MTMPESDLESPVVNPEDVGMAPLAPSVDTEVLDWLRGLSMDDFEPEAPVAPEVERATEGQPRAAEAPTVAGKTGSIEGDVRKGMGQFGEGVGAAVEDKALEYADRILAGDDASKMGVPVPMRERVQQIVDEKRRGLRVSVAEAPAPGVPVTPSAEVGVTTAPGGDGGREALEKEQVFLNEFKLAHEISAQAAACAERPWPESVEAISGRRDLKAAELSALKETMGGAGLAQGDELQIKVQREKSVQEYLGLQRTIDGLKVGDLERGAKATVLEARRLSVESSVASDQAKIEKIKVAEELKAWTRAEKTARSNGLPEAGLAVFESERQNAKNRLNIIEERAKYLSSEAVKKEAEAEQARIEFGAAQANIQRLNVEKNQARLAAENWQKKLVDPARQLAEMRQQEEELEQEVTGLGNILRTEAIYTEISEVADAFGQLNPSYIHQSGAEADLLQAMREGFPGTQVERDYIFTLAQQPEYANMTIPQLQQVFRDRSNRMNRILELEAAGIPEDRARKLLTDPQYPRFPASFRSAVESTINGNSFLAELPSGSDPVLSKANRAQRQTYTDIMFALGLQPQTPEASEAQTASLIQREQSGELAIQMAELYAGESLPAELRSPGAEHGTGAWEIWRENVMKWSRDRVYQQQLDNYADPKLAAVAVEAATAQAELEGQVTAEKNRATLAEAETASREDALKMTQQQVAEMTPLAGEVNRQIESAINSVDDVVWGLVPEDQKRELTALELHLGETVGQRREKILRAAQAAIEAGLGLEGKENDEAHKAGVAEVLKATMDYYSGKLTPEQTAERVDKWRKKRVGGVGGVGGREKTLGELQAAGLQVAGAEMEQMRRAKNLSKVEAQNIAQRASALNTALEGAGVIGAGMGGILDGGFKLAIETMFSAGR